MSEVLEKPETKFVRWIATVYYRTDNGLIDVQHDIEELEEIQELVECGPDWNTIERVDIVLSDKRYASLTVEQSEQL